MKDRYTTADSIKTQFQNGSHERVLKNFLGIKRKRN